VELVRRREEDKKDYKIILRKSGKSIGDCALEFSVQQTWTGLGLTADAAKWIVGTGICNTLGIFEIRSSYGTYPAGGYISQGLSGSRANNASRKKLVRK
jgi:hypothetical protein